MALAKALQVSQGATASSIPHATVTVFVAGSDTSHANHLTQLGVQVAKISDTLHVLADLNSTLHAAIVNEWFALQLPGLCFPLSCHLRRSTMHFKQRMKLECARKQIARLETSIARVRHVT